MSSDILQLKRGDIVLVNLDPKKGSEQGKTRPSLVIQNDTGNKYSPTTIIAPLTSSYEKVYPVNVEVKQEGNDLEKDSVVLLNQIFTVDMDARIIKKIGTLSDEKMEGVDEAIKISLGID